MLTLPLSLLGAILHGIKIVSQIISYGFFWKSFYYISHTSFVVDETCDCCAERVTDICSEICKTNYNSEDLISSLTSYNVLVPVVIGIYHGFELILFAFRLRFLGSPLKLKPGFDATIDKMASDQYEALKKKLCCCYFIPNCFNIFAIMFLAGSFVVYRGCFCPLYHLVKRIGVFRISSIMVSISVSVLIARPRDHLSYRDQCALRLGGILLLVFVGFMIGAVVISVMYRKCRRSVLCYAARNNLLIASVFVMIALFIVTSPNMHIEFPTNLSFNVSLFYVQLVLSPLVFGIDMLNSYCGGRDVKKHSLGGGNPTDLEMGSPTNAINAHNAEGVIAQSAVDISGAIVDQARRISASNQAAAAAAGVAAVALAGDPGKQADKRAFDAQQLHLQLNQQQQQQPQHTAAPAAHAPLANDKGLERKDSWAMS
jgi:hypothetical protein